MAHKEDLDKLYKLIAGNAVPMWGRGIHTYIGGDERNDEVHLACLELEKAGKIYRKINEPGHVFWLSSD
jgi:hypothetical protein